MDHVRPHSLGPRRWRGFTLIELMIAVVVVAVLAAIALPSFLDSTRKSRRSDAFAALNQVMQAQERFRANNASYASSLTNAANGSPPGLALTSTSANSHYSLTLSDVTAAGYSAVATAQSGSSQANDTQCVQLRVRVAGGNVFYGAAPSSGSFDETNAARCWNR